MKLRIKSNSVRLRLTRTEVADLAAGKTIIQTTPFTHAVQLVSSIEVSSQASAVMAVFESSRLSVIIPHERARQWAQSEEVSIHAEQPIDDQLSLSLLIEKDFQCLHHLENNQDSFPNPRMQNVK